VKIEQLIAKGLKAAFGAQPAVHMYILSLSKSVRNPILQWLVLAKRPETRQKRIAEVVELAALRRMPTHILKVFFLGVGLRCNRMYWLHCLSR
jgi:hypothetical protein